METANSNKRLSPAEALDMWHNLTLGELGESAIAQKLLKSQNKVFYNQNIHIEPTNICSMECTFCSFRRQEGEQGAWNYSLEEIEEICKSHAQKPLTEVHIVGGVDPKRDFEYYEELLRLVKKHFPTATLKAYTAVELHHIITKAGLPIIEGLSRLKEAGMGAIAGGGAEIFADRVRRRICPKKCNAQEWLSLHRAAHSLGITSNATILYGHIETIEERIEHLDMLRSLQDETSGFNAFIPLKFKPSGNELGREVTSPTVIEDMRFFALCRLYLDNFDHIKAYWPMMGKDSTELALSYGADDIDGTIDDTTKIYSLAGAEDQNPRLTVGECHTLIKNAGFEPAERDSFYNTIEK
ncbi:MAG: CofH family radical SAM protein [Rikenellaceae bacterium]